MQRHRVEPYGLAAGTLTVAMAVVYVRIMQEQGDRPLWWVLLVLGAAAGLVLATAAGASRVLAGVAAVLLLGLGFLAILSIGLPILAAGVLALVSALRGPRVTQQVLPTAPRRPAGH